MQKYDNIIIGDRDERQNNKGEEQRQKNGIRYKRMKQIQQENRYLQRINNKQKYKNYLSNILINENKKNEQKLFKYNPNLEIKIKKLKFQERVQQFIKWNKQYKSKLAFNKQQKQLKNNKQINIKQINNNKQQNKIKKNTKNIKLQFQHKIKQSIKLNKSLSSILHQQKTINIQNQKKYQFSNRNIKQDQHSLNLLRSMECKNKRFHSIDHSIYNNKLSSQLLNDSNQQEIDKMRQKQKKNKNSYYLKCLNQQEQQKMYSPKKFVRYRQLSEILKCKQKKFMKEELLGCEDGLISVKKLMPESKRNVKQLLREINRGNGYFSSLKKNHKSHRKNIKTEEYNIIDNEHEKKYLLILDHKKFQFNSKKLNKKYHQSFLQNMQKTQRFLQTNLLYSPWQAISNPSVTTDQNICQNFPSL